MDFMNGYNEWNGSRRQEEQYLYFGSLSRSWHSFWKSTNKPEISVPTFFVAVVEVVVEVVVVVAIILFAITGTRQVFEWSG